MKLPGKSKKSIDIAEYYSVNVRSIWDGFKQEGAAFKWLCVYFFLEYVRPQGVYPVLDILPWGQLSLLATCIAAISDPTIKWVKNTGNSLLVVYFIVVLLSAIFAFKPSLAFAKADIIINWLILYFLMITIITTEKRLIVFLLVFFVANFKMSLFGFRSFLAHGYSSWGVAGSPGWFKDAGDLGIEMTIFVALSMGFVMAVKGHLSKIKRYFFYFLPVTGVVTIIATSSRGAMLGIAAAGFWFLAKSRLGIKAIAGALVVGGLIYVVLPPEMFVEFDNVGEDATSVTRLALWSFGMEIMRDHPVFGIGYSNWVSYCWYMNPNGVDNLGLCSIQHNTMVQAVSETGITGFILYVSNILFVFITNARTRKNASRIDNKFILYTAHGLDGGLIAYLVSSFFFSVLFYPMFWVQLAMTVVLSEISKKKSSEMEAKLKNKSRLSRNTHGHMLE